WSRRCSQRLRPAGSGRASPGAPTPCHRQRRPAARHAPPPTARRCIVRSSCSPPRRALDQESAVVSTSPPAFTDLQGQYLAFIYPYSTVHRRPPAEADMQAFFEVTPPSVHRMVLELEQRGLISRRPGQARSIELLLPPEQLPVLR